MAGPGEVELVLRNCGHFALVVRAADDAAKEQSLAGAGCVVSRIVTAVACRRHSSFVGPVSGGEVTISALQFVNVR